MKNQVCSIVSDVVHTSIYESPDLHKARDSAGRDLAHASEKRAYKIDRACRTEVYRNIVAGPRT